jgi:predicted AAA+ superfamily ATPase
MGYMQYHTVERTYWIQEIEKAWAHRSIIWLTGVRRAGKTFLCKSLPNIEYFDCELPRVRRTLEDPEEFLKSVQGKRLVLDEIHHLPNPSQFLKIAADHYPETKIIATGSSTLGASKKFRDTLAGRKTQIWLTPMLLHESALFGRDDISHRMLFGGLPSVFLRDELPEQDYKEWIDSYWARDIQELFQLEKRYSFLKFTELVLAQSGSIFEATKFTAPCEISRGTVANYLAVLEATSVAQVVRPFSSHRSTEIVSAPKVYGFDTGFVCFARGLANLRNDDKGHLWEHLVLNELNGRIRYVNSIRYWRDKRDHEIDFIFSKQRNSGPIAIECKLKADNFEPAALKAFRRHYPHGDNFVVATDIDRSFQKNYDDLFITFVHLEELIQLLQR